MQTQTFIYSRTVFISWCVILFFQFEGMGGFFFLFLVSGGITEAESPTCSSLYDLLSSSQHRVSSMTQCGFVCVSTEGGVRHLGWADYSQYKHLWITSLVELISPVFTAEMNTDFDRACQKAIFHSCSTEAGLSGKRGSYEGSWSHCTYYHQQLWWVKDLINSYFFFKNTQFTLSFIGYPPSNSSMSPLHVEPVGQFFLFFFLLYISCHQLLKIHLFDNELIEILMMDIGWSSAVRFTFYERDLNQSYQLKQ